jgi:hypothetical protein
MGKVTEYATLHRRVVYQVVGKENTNPVTSFATHRYMFRVAFDFENPMGTNLDAVAYMGTRDLKRIELLDLGTIRLHFDNFLREWALKMGHGDVTPE